MPVTPQQVREVAPELTTESDDRINLFIAFAENSTNRSYYQENADLAVILLTAHLLHRANIRGRAGAISSESVGAMSRSYGFSARREQMDLTTTSYGEWLLRLRSQYVRTPMIV